MRRKISIILLANFLVLLATQARAQQLIEVKITSSPSGARVYLDDKFAGRTPLKTQIAEGEHNIKLDYREGYISIDKDILVTPKNDSFHYRFKMTGGEIFGSVVWGLVIILAIMVISQPSI